MAARRHTLLALSCVGTLLAIGMAPVTAVAQELNTSWWSPNDRVYASARSGDTLYVGGQFTYVGPRTGSAVALSDSTGRYEPVMPMVAGTVNAIVPDGQGGWYLGGAFVAVGGQSRAGLARLGPDFSLLPWNPGCNGTVQALCVAGSRLYVGGQFTSIGGMSRANLAAFDAASGDTSSQVLGTNAAVLDLHALGARLYVGGSFTTIQATARNFVAALDTATGGLTAWNAAANGAVRAFASYGATLFVGGSFTSIGGLARTSCAAFDSSSGALTTWAPPLGGPVYALSAGPVVVRVGGQFASSGGQPRGNAAAFDRVSGALDAWNPNLDGAVHTIAPCADGVLLGGAFGAAGVVPRRSIARVDSVGGAPLAWDGAAGGTVYRLLTAGNRVLACGAFTSAGGFSRNRVAAYDMVTGDVTGWDPNANGTVRALLAHQGTVYLGGLFTQVGAAAHARLAAVDAATGAADPWNPALDNTVYALASDGTSLYAGGQFTAAGGLPRSRLAAFALDTHELGLLNVTVDNTIFALTVSNGRLYAGGDFLTFGLSRPRAGAVNLATRSVTSWNPNFDNTVYALASDDRAVYAGGAFSRMGVWARPYLASVNPFTGQTTNALFTRQPNNKVHALAIAGSTLYMGGDFSSVGGTWRAQFAAVDTATGQLSNWAPSGNGAGHTFAFGPGMVVLGGAFTQVNGADLPYLAVVLGSTPAISAASTTVNEGSNGAWTLSVPVGLTGPSPDIVSLHWTLRDSTARVADGDYVAASGTLVIPPGDTHASIEFTVYGDLTYEPAEILTLEFDQESGATLSTTRALVTLLNDDPLPKFAIADLVQPEGSVGETPFAFALTLSNPSVDTITVAVSTADGSATAASGDYVPRTQVLTLLPGTTSATFTVAVAGDSTLERDESFFVHLDQATHAGYTDLQAVGTILTDELGPVITALDDMPGDQGGWVRLSLERSLLDAPEETAHPVFTYNVWRRVSALPAAPSRPAIAPAWPAPALGERELAALAEWPVQLRDGHVLVESNSTAPGPAAYFPPGTWAIVTSFAAFQQPNYEVVVPTAADAPDTSHFVVSAHTNSPAYWCVGWPIAGASLDNIAPGVPGAFAAQAAGVGVALSWSASEARDFQYFRLYRGDAPGFALDEAHLVHQTTALAWTDAAPGNGTHWYQLVALDHAGNAGAAAAASVTLTLGADPGLPRAFALSMPSPNPFSDRATFEFAAPRACEARVAVYDVGGRLVRVLHQGALTAGRHAFRWDGRDASGGRAAAGVYLCRAEGGGFRAARRVVSLP